MNKLWGFGTAAVDFRIITADYGENYRDKLVAQQTYSLGGGAAANCLVQAARLGGKVGWIGKLGQDKIGKQIIKLLSDEGIDCSNAVFSDEEISPFNVAVYAGKNRRRVGGFLLPNSLATLTSDEIEVFSLAMQSGDWLMIEIGEIPVKHCIELARIAKVRGVKVALDVDLDPVFQCNASAKDVEILFSLADLLIPNINSLKSMYDIKEPEILCETLFSRYNVPVVITAGDKGAYYIEDDGVLCHEKALSVQVTDTVGAGDAFHGGLLFALTCNKPLSEAVRMGTATAAVNCTVFGAREGMPDLARVIKEMEKFDE